VSISPQTRNWLRQSAALDGAVVSQTLLNLLERVEALEAAQPVPTPEGAPVATDKEVQKVLRAYDLYLGRQPTPPPAPVGGLVDRVLCALPSGVDRLYARAAIRKVAAWMRENETGYNATRWLEQEASR